jgi:hypothetical protein
MATLTQARTIALPDNREVAGAARVAGMLLIAQFVQMFAALFILGSAINWPASLDEPAAVMLPLIAAQAPAVALGYTAYFLSALLLAPIALLLYGRLQTPASQPILRVAAGLGVLASFAKLLGIARWLVLMPGLAQAYIAPDASETTRAAIAVAYEGFNAYAGGVGEVLGVALLSGLWTLLVSVVLASGRSGLPRWLGWFGLLAAVLLLAALPAAYGVDMGPILIIQGLAWQFWLLTLGILLLRGAGRR